MYYFLLKRYCDEFNFALDGAYLIFLIILFILGSVFLFVCVEPGGTQTPADQHEGFETRWTPEVQTIKTAGHRPSSTH